MLKMIPKSQNKQMLQEREKPEYDDTIEHKILVVSDETDWKEKAMMHIKRPYEAVGCSQREVWDEFNSDNYSLVIIDNDNDPGEGFNTLRAIRSVDKKTPIIYTSVRHNDETELAKMGLHVNVRDTCDIVSPNVRGIIREWLENRCEEK